MQGVQEVRGFGAITGEFLVVGLRGLGDSGWGGGGGVEV